MDIFILQKCHSDLLSEFHTSNHEYFSPWSPKTSLSDHSKTAWNKKIDTLLDEQNSGKAIYFVGIKDNKIIARCSLTEIVRGVFQACYMGFCVSEEFEGQGLAYQISIHAINHAFDDLSIHRIMAGYMPHNNRSAKLLKKLGFRIEGFARNYLKINGKWENSFLTSLANTKT